MKQTEIKETTTKKKQRQINQRKKILWKNKINKEIGPKN